MITGAKLETPGTPYFGALENDTYLSNMWKNIFREKIYSKTKGKTTLYVFLIF